VDGQWQLAGIIYSVEGFSGQPNPIFTAVFGNETLLADLSFYRPQIVAVVPEPPAGLLAAGAAGWIAAAARRRRRSAAPARDC
jgi:hypothetical protein